MGRLSLPPLGRYEPALDLGAGHGDGIAVAGADLDAGEDQIARKLGAGEAQLAADAGAAEEDRGGGQPGGINRPTPRDDPGARAVEIAANAARRSAGHRSFGDRVLQG